MKKKNIKGKIVFILLSGKKNETKTNYRDGTNVKQKIGTKHEIFANHRDDFINLLKNIIV